METLWHNANNEFQHWAQQPLKQRVAVLLCWHKALHKLSLTQDTAQAQQCVLQLKQQLQYFCLMAQRHLSDQVLPGPTGETNSLKTTGQGIYLVADLDERGSDHAFCQLLLLSCAAMLAGNSVIMRYNGQLQHWHKLLLISLHKQLPEYLLQITCSQSMQRLLDAQILAGVVGISEQNPPSNTLHCQVQGAPIRHVNIYAPQQLSNCMLLPDFLIGFCSQTCVSDNTAAMGGNAQLLAQP
ncbi:hypothetical protein [Motilimonas pumila]|uniref:Uncharacterized protein n=1 Tax=Motilimonas pumila TaxID=2303987 RepID=A0A418YAG7_9GAMM|nr:hypothetical protein [Motilimonas pumila]RJG39525.1 hypothetical protein D1Z90_17970 [Motilimonas pumila]